MLDMNDNVSTVVKRLAVESGEGSLSGCAEGVEESCQGPGSLISTGRGDMFTETGVQEEEGHPDNSSQEASCPPTEEQEKLINLSFNGTKYGSGEDTTAAQPLNVVFEEMLADSLTSHKSSLNYEQTAEHDIISQPHAIVFSGSGEEIQVTHTMQENVINLSDGLGSEETVETSFIAQTPSYEFQQMVENRMSTHPLTVEPGGCDKVSVVYWRPTEDVCMQKEGNNLPSTFEYQGTEEDVFTHPRLGESAAISYEDISKYHNFDRSQETEMVTPLLHIECIEAGIREIVTHPATAESEESIFQHLRTTESDTNTTPSSPVGYEERLLLGYSGIISSPATDLLPPRASLSAPSSLCPWATEDAAGTRQRRTSMKSGKTPPGTPVEEKKFVRFADALGLELAKVKTFSHEVAPDVPKSAFCDLENVRLESSNIIVTPELPATDLVPLFTQPVGLPDFLQRIRKDKVCLENAIAKDDHTITGIVRVLNIDYIKSLYVRFTVDEWKSFTEVKGDYVPNSHDGFSDKFSFVFTACLNAGERILFAVRYHCAGQLFWDNNFKQNYVFKCFKRRPKRASVVCATSPFFQ